MIVSLAIVARDAELFLPDLLSDILSQTYDKKKIQLIFVDSCSVDKTKEIFEKFKIDHESEFLSVSIKDNLKKTIPCGCNVALKEVTGEVFVRVNAHTRIREDFIEKNIEYHKSGELITGVVFNSIIHGDSLWKKLLLFVESSPFEGSIAEFKDSNKIGYVKTIPNAFYNMKVFKDVGEYDERLPRSEDNEIHYRMRKKGYKLLLIGDLGLCQYVRSSLRGISKQKFLNGRWISLTLGVSPKCFSVYHFIPFIFLVSILFFTILFLLFSIKYPLIFLVFTYLVISLSMTFFSMFKIKEFDLIYLISPLLFFYLHITYGLGSLYGLIELPFWKSKKENKSKLLQKSNM